MDGLPHSDGPLRLAGGQRTLKSAIGCVGVGLHTGAKVRLTLLPAPPGAGIGFRRLDLAGAPDIAAEWRNVAETRLCTVLALPDDDHVRVSTVEHVMAALVGAGVTDAVVAVDGPEVPILDGSAASFLFLLDCAGVVVQDGPSVAFAVRRPVRVERGAASAALLPSRPGCGGLELDVTIDFPAEAIGRQALRLELTPDSFRRALSRARTFTMVEEIERLRAVGLAQGGSLENAVVVDGARVLNPGGLRAPDEFVRHKMLDAVGDLALAGASIQGRFVGHCSGHALNIELLRAFFADPTHWREVACVERLVPEAHAIPGMARHLSARGELRAA